MTATLPGDEHLSITERSYRAYDADEAERPHAELPQTPQVDAALQLVRPLAEEGADAA